jgi:hypothetical protein
MMVYLQYPGLIYQLWGLANSDKGITIVQHQPISSDSKKRDDILKKIDRMGKRLDILLKSQKRHQKKKPVIPSIMVGIEVERLVLHNGNTFI